MCERWVGDWTNYNILTPSSFVFSSASFSFCWAAQSGALCWVLVLSAATYLQLTPTLNFLSHRVISLFYVHLLPVSVAFAPNSTCPRSRLYLDVFDRMNLFLVWRLGRRSICYIIRLDGFPFHSIYGQPYLVFLFVLVSLFCGVPLALLSVDGMSHFCIFIHNRIWN